MSGASLRKAKFLIIFLVFMFFSSGYSFGQASLYINQPVDKLITYEPVIKISGKASEIGQLMVNGISIDLDRNGGFLAGLKLQPGKNYVGISAVPTKGKKILKTIRILRLVSFPDMDMLYEGKTHWAKKAIIDLATLGIIEGYPDNYFYPTVWISRGELATWLCRTMGLATKVPQRDVFYDVPKEHWRAPYIKAVVEAGGMKAFSKNLFGISDVALRSEVTEIMRATLKIPLPKKTLQVFRDVPLTLKGAPDIYVTYVNKLVKGMSKTEKIFKPEDYVTRAQVAILFSRVPSIQKKISLLYDFNKDYSGKVLCKINTAPIIEMAVVDPREIIVGEKSWITISAKVVDKEGQEDISRVTVDLSALGGPPDAEMFDDGTHGDGVANDKIFNLKFIAAPGVSGEKKLELKAVDKSTWEGKGAVKLFVVMPIKQ